MRTIIAGSRWFNDAAQVEIAMRKCGWRPSIVVSGGAPGVDRLGEQWASKNGIACVIVRAHWHEHGKAAGPLRNRAMADQADALVALWDGWSRGTKDMIDVGVSRGLTVYVHFI